MIERGRFLAALLVAAALPCAAAQPYTPLPPLPLGAAHRNRSHQACGHRPTARTLLDVLFDGSGVAAGPARDHGVIDRDRAVLEPLGSAFQQQWKNSSRHRSSLSKFPKSA